MKRYDAHAHLPLDTESSRRFFVERNLSVLNICVASDELGGLDAQRNWYRSLHTIDSQRYSWITSFALDNFGNDGWTEHCITKLDEDFTTGGAAGCKVWKNIGMELRDPATGDFVFVDDPRFEPIFAHLERTGKPLLAHIGEPIAAWRALDPTDPHHAYFSVAKQWHWHGRSDVPSHERLIAARDAVIARHPALIFVGLHFGSQEHDFAGVADRLRQWPNYFVDTGARLGDLVRNTARDRDSVRLFFKEFVNRIIWGVDWVLTAPVSTRTLDQQSRLLQAFETRYDLEWRFFATDERIRVGPNECRGLALDSAELQQLMNDNARRIYGLS